MLVRRISVMADSDRDIEAGLPDTDTGPESAASAAAVATGRPASWLGRVGQCSSYEQQASGPMWRLYCQSCSVMAVIVAFLVRVFTRLGKSE